MTGKDVLISGIIINKNGVFKAGRTIVPPAEVPAVLSLVKSGMLSSVDPVRDASQIVRSGTINRFVLLNSTRKED